MGLSATLTNAVNTIFSSLADFKDQYTYYNKKRVKNLGVFEDQIQTVTANGFFVDKVTGDEMQNIPTTTQALIVKNIDFSFEPSISGKVTVNGVEWEVVSIESNNFIHIFQIKR